MQILIVDDDVTTRHLVARTVRNLGYEVATASDGIEAWHVLQKAPISLVITDWMMPEMDGLRLCKQIRSADLPHYVYTILMTTSEDKNALIKGMGAGADDFIVKPLDRGELNARLKAGERILKLQDDLEKRNEKLSESNKKLSDAYSMMKRDLEAGAKIQSSLLPQSSSIIYGIRFDSIFLPSAYVAGDVFNYFKLDENHVGFYVLDVAGHGIPAAMLSVTLSKALSPTNHQESLLKQFMPVPEPPYFKIINPAMAIRALNERFQADEDTMQYFTMIYGLIDIRDGRTVMTQAGHPPPIFLQKGKQTISIGTGGYPVGMLPDLEYEEEAVLMHQGDRLILYSDGISECTNNQKEQFSVRRLINLIQEGQDLSLRELMERIQESLRLWNGDDQFEDDMTLLALEMV